MMVRALIRKGKIWVFLFFNLLIDFFFHYESKKDAVISCRIKFGTSLALLFTCFVRS
jgi:hypothetical protein